MENALHVSALVDTFLILTLFLAALACSGFCLVDVFLFLFFGIEFVFGLLVLFNSELTDLVIISLSESEIA